MDASFFTQASPRARGRLAVALACAAFFGAVGSGCAPKVKCFRVVKHQTPLPAASPWCGVLAPRLCTGGLVDVTWEVKGAATLFSDPRAATNCPSVPNHGRVSAKGTTTCQVATTTKLTVRAGPSLTAPMWWKYDEGVSEVTVGPVPAPLGAQGACTATRYEAVVVRDPLQWDPDFKVLKVSVAGQLLDRFEKQPGLKLHLAHAGVEETLDAAHPDTSKFECTLYGGDWTLTLPLSPGKTCAEDPVFLTVQVTTTCGPCSPTP
jgi:hypothetical protein